MTCDVWQVTNQSIACVATLAASHSRSHPHQQQQQQQQQPVPAAPQQPLQAHQSIFSAGSRAKSGPVTKRHLHAVGKGDMTVRIEESCVVLSRAHLQSEAAAACNSDGKAKHKPVQCNTGYNHTPHVTCYTSHVTRHTSHITRHTSHVTRHTSHVTRHTSHVTRHTSHVTRPNGGGHVTR